MVFAVVLIAACTDARPESVAEPTVSEADQPSLSPSPTPSSSVEVPPSMRFDRARIAMWQWAGRLPEGTAAKASYLSRGYLVVNGRRVVFVAPVEDRGGSLLGARDGRWFVRMAGNKLAAVDASGSVVQEYPSFANSAANQGHDLIVSGDGRLMVNDQRLIRTRDAKVIGRTPRDVFLGAYWPEQGLVYRRAKDYQNYYLWNPGQPPIKVPSIQYLPSGFGVEIGRRGCFTWYKLTSDGAEPLVERCDPALTPKAVPDGGSPLRSRYLSDAGFIVKDDRARPLAIPQRPFYAMGGYITALWESDRDVLISIPAPVGTEPDDGWGARIVLVRCPADGRPCERVPGVIRTADVSQLFHMIRTPPS